MYRKSFDNIIFFFIQHICLVSEEGNRILVPPGTALQARPEQYFDILWRFIGSGPVTTVVRFLIKSIVFLNSKL